MVLLSRWVHPATAKVRNREESTEIRLSLPYPDSDLFSDGKLRVVTVREGMRP